MSVAEKWCGAIHKKFWVYIRSIGDSNVFSKTPIPRSDGDGRQYVFCERCGRVYSVPD